MSTYIRTLVLASRKGGVGKTTLAGHLAVEAEAAGAGPVVLLDADPQQSLSAWHAERQAATPALAAAELGRLPGQLLELERAGYQLAIIDTPPTIDATIARVLRSADLVLIPTRPSPHDLRALGSTVAECGDRRPVFVLNGAAHRARITAEAAIALSSHGAVCPTVLHQRTDLAGSMTDGRTVRELDPGGRSAAEISAIWAYVHTHLRRRRA